MRAEGISLLSLLFSLSPPPPLLFSFSPPPFPSFLPPSPLLSPPSLSPPLSYVCVRWREPQAGVEAAVETEAGLRERGFGSLEGRHYAHYDAVWPRDRRVRAADV